MHSGTKSQAAAAAGGSPDPKEGARKASQQSPARAASGGGGLLGDSWIEAGDVLGAEPASPGEDFLLDSVRTKSSRTICRFNIAKILLALMAQKPLGWGTVSRAFTALGRLRLWQNLLHQKHDQIEPEQQDQNVLHCSPALDQENIDCCLAPRNGHANLQSGQACVEALAASHQSFMPHPASCSHREVFLMW